MVDALRPLDAELVARQFFRERIPRGPPGHYQYRLPQGHVDDIFIPGRLRRGGRWMNDYAWINNYGNLWFPQIGRFMDTMNHGEVSRAYLRYRLSRLLRDFREGRAPWSNDRKRDQRKSRVTQAYPVPLMTTWLGYSRPASPGYFCEETYNFPQRTH